MSAISWRNIGRAGLRHPTIGRKELVFSPLNVHDVLHESSVLREAFRCCAAQFVEQRMLVNQALGVPALLTEIASLLKVHQIVVSHRPPFAQAALVRG